MPVTRYHSIEEMPRPWRDAASQENLRLVVRMLAFHRALVGGGPRKRGVHRFQSLEKARASLDDPYRPR